MSCSHYRGVEQIAVAQSWRMAAAFNQPLIPVWRSSGQLQIQLPFLQGILPHSFVSDAVARAFPRSFSLISTDNGLIADLYRPDDQIEAIVLNADPRMPTLFTSGDQQTRIPPAALKVAPVLLTRP